MLAKEIELKKWGNSQGFRISKEELSELGDPSATKFDMVIDYGKIVLTPKKDIPSTLDELFEDYEGSPLGEEEKFDWGNPVGREIV
ncbi:MULTISPECIES: AbrB/MazE/SpoVT family DNA-binding domain-containing protein [Enterococcus]|uniref:AbrB/MazE/SpoVT family DNA-binding domain-containing protein n=1 Tax=Enterococcus TaxID=1350 RepID=UPI00065E6D7E|nr:MULTISPECIES: toxin-antitoxin system, antitoxin component, AbrB family protein [Enterococcus]